MEEDKMDEIKDEVSRYDGKDNYFRRMGKENSGTGVELLQLRM